MLRVSLMTTGGPRVDPPPGQKSRIEPMGLSIRMRCRYGFAFSAHFGTTLSRIDGGACGRSDNAGFTSSEVKPGGGVGGCGRDELNRKDPREGTRGRTADGKFADLCGILERERHLSAPRPSIGSMVDAGVV